ncbi:unnamed protein product, partial [Laminaria digitata]
HGGGGSAAGAAHPIEKKAKERGFWLPHHPWLRTSIPGGSTGHVHVWQLRLTLLLGTASDVTLGVLETRLRVEILAPGSESAEENFVPVGGGSGSRWSRW